MGQSRLYLTISVIALCAVSSGAYSTISSRFTYTAVSFVGKVALSELIFNFAPAEASSYPFFHRMGHYAKSSEESDEDEEENASHGRIGLPNSPASQTDQCLAKLLCGMSVAASNKATKPDYYKDYAHLVSRYFQVFGSEDGSIESIEAYDDYSVEDDEPPPPPPPAKSKTPEKFDISLGFTSFLSSITNHSDSSEPTANPKAVRNRGAGKLSQLRLARAAKILENLNRQGRKPQPSHCQSLTGCSYSFKELRAKLKSGTKGKLPTSSSSSGKAPLRYKVHASHTKPISSSNNKESNEQQFLAFKDPHKGDDEMEEIFGADAFAPAKPKKKKNQMPEPPPPPPIYIRRTIIKKKRPSSSSSTGTNDDEESASTTIIRVAPSPIQQQQSTPIEIPQADIGDDIDDKPKRKVNYKKPPKKTKVKDNGDDEDDDINQTLPVKIISSAEYNDDHHKIYNIDSGYQKDVPATVVKAVPGKEKVFPDKKKKDEDSDEEDEESEEEEEDEENDDEEEEESSKKKSKSPAPVRKPKPSIVVEGDDIETKKKLSDDDEVAEAQKDFWGGLTFVNRKKEREANAKLQTKTKYKLNKDKVVQSSASNEEESKEDENSKESEENDEEKERADKKQVGNKPARGKLDIDIPPSAELDLAFPARREKEKVSLKAKANKRKDNKKKDDSSSEEENASFVITEIGGRPLAPPKDPSLKTGTASASAAQPSPFKLQFISPYPSKQKSSSSYSVPSVYGGGISKAEKLKPALPPLTSHAFLKSNLPTNAAHSPVQGKPDMFSRITSLSPISSLTNFFRKGSTPKQDTMQESGAPPTSPFMKRPVGPESSKFRRSPSRDKKKKKN